LSDRKPPGIRSEDWIERQIREAQERGVFDDLPGAGKPLVGLDRPFTAERWAADWARREGGDLAAMLPPLLVLRRERAALVAALARVPSEVMLRELVADFNRRLLDQYRRPTGGPLVPVGLLDLDETLDTWRRLRPMPAPVVDTGPTPRPSRWWQRRQWRRRAE